MPFIDKSFSAGISAIVLFLILVLPAGCGNRDSKYDFPEWSKPVMDSANVISPEDEEILDSFYLEFEKLTSAQIAIYTTKTLDEEDIAMFATELGQRWGVGQKGKDNGIVIVLAVDDRKYFTVIGAGFEGALPDSLVGTLQRNLLVPALKNSEYGRGLREYVHALAIVVGREEGIDISGALSILGVDSEYEPPTAEVAAALEEKRKQDEAQLRRGAYIGLGFLGIIIVAIILAVKYGKPASGGGSSRKRPTRGFGGFSSGGFRGGGFSGGGGGGFRGGGAGGSW